MDLSPLQISRYLYKPVLPEVISGDFSSIISEAGEPTESAADREELKAIFPGTYGMPMVSFKQGTGEPFDKAIHVGVVLSGGQAPGGHNVIAGLFDAVRKGNPKSKVFGFRGGPSGILHDKVLELTSEYVDQFRNTGGFDIIGSGRTKLETEEEFDTCVRVLGSYGISALVVIGGDDSNTNAAVLAEYFKQTNSGISVIGVPKTIDGDLKNEQIEISFGFDTATKTYSELIGNIARDANSAKKYWHFIKLMGRSASHICLECALQTHPNIALISEEVEAREMGLLQLVENIVETIVKRAEGGENFGVILIPEGLIEFIPEMKLLIGELNDVLASGDIPSETFTENDTVRRHLSAKSAELFLSLPANIRSQLLMDRDPHGNVQVSRIETEKLLIDMVETRLAALKKEGRYNGAFSHQSHFFGYEGRCAFPSNFDADYCYALGFNAFLLIASGLTGYISSVTHLAAPPKSWKAGGVPLTMMMNLEQRHGRKKPVIKKALVELGGKPFNAFNMERRTWAVKTSFVYPGAIQYYGPDEVCNRPTLTLALESRRE